MKIRNREEYERFEEQMLSALAQKSGFSKGRIFPEEEHPFRTSFQRDRDRVLHSRSFRRLMYKTQVFINHEGDHYRTRYTHTMEVAQIARNIARTLRLNEDLTEAISLAHDVGHAPFGHTGEKTLNGLMADKGGFEHNRQSLRMVEVLEKRYPGFDGLNLTWEVREGIIKHSTSYDHPGKKGFEPEKSASMEAQIVDLADQIAYNTHDIDDGLAAVIISEKDLHQIELWRMVTASIEKRFMELDEELKRNFAIRSLIDFLVTDVVNNTCSYIEKSNIKTADEVINNPEKSVFFSPAVSDALKEMESFLFLRLYCHTKIRRIAHMTDKIISDLFCLYIRNPDLLPSTTQAKIKKSSTEQVICDYLAGMTDRFALNEHQRLIGKKYRQLSFNSFP